MVADEISRSVGSVCGFDLPGGAGVYKQTDASRGGRSFPLMNGNKDVRISSRFL